MTTPKPSIILPGYNLSRSPLAFQPLQPSPMPKRPNPYMPKPLNLPKSISKSPLQHGGPQISRYKSKTPIKIAQMTSHNMQKNSASKSRQLWLSDYKNRSSVQRAFAPKVIKAKLPPPPKFQPFPIAPVVTRHCPLIQPSICLG